MEFRLVDGRHLHRDFLVSMMTTRRFSGSILSATVSQERDTFWYRKNSLKAKAPCPIHLQAVHWPQAL